MIEWDSKYASCLEERNRIRTQLTDLTISHGYALESIRQLVNLAIDKGHKRDVAVTTAQRFLRELESTKND